MELKSEVSPEGGGGPGWGTWGTVLTIVGSL